jgi:predicted permease
MWSRAGLREWAIRLWWTLRPGRRDDDLEEELRAHLALAAEGHGRRGESVDAPRRVALRWGSAAGTMDALRDQRGVPWIDELKRDVRDALRTLRRNPIFALVVLSTLAISSGANTAVFTVLDTVLFKPLAYPKSEELVAVWHIAPGAPGLADVSGDLRLSASMYFTYAEHNRTFQAFGLWQVGSATVTGVAEPEQVRTLLVTDGTLQALGVPPALGRLLSAVDQAPGAAPTVMLSHGYWQRRFGGERSLIGRPLTVNSRAHEVVGVMPEGFRMLDADVELIAPLAFDRSRVRLPGFGFQAIARLRPDATVNAANADIGRMVPIWMRSWPAAPGVNPSVYESWRIGPAVRPLKDDVVGRIGSVLWVVMGSVGIVLLIACANVANLTLVRSEARQQELAVRASLGAGRGRIVRSILIESVTLALVGGAIGIGLAAVALRALVWAAPANLPRLTEIAIDGRALTCTLLISLVSGALCGLIPALRSSGAHLSDTLRSTGPTTAGAGRHPARHALVIAQVALASVLLVSAGLLMRTLQTLRTIEPGVVDLQHLQAVRIAIPTNMLREPEEVARMQRDIAEKLAALPGVASGNWDVIEPEGQTLASGELPLRVFRGISPRFFQTTGTRVIAGREYVWADLADRRPYVIVSENLARELWTTPQDALGKRIRTLPGAPWREVIGVVQDVRDNGTHEPSPAIVYWPTIGESVYRAGQTQVDRTVTYLVRTSRAGSESLLSEMRHAVWSVNGSLPLASVQTIHQVYERSMSRTSFTFVMVAIAATVALLLGLVGLYGIVAYAVVQRTREIGIRLAIGARQGELQRMFVRRALVTASAGIGIGLVASLGFTRLMSSLLVGVSALDPWTYLTVTPVSLTTALLASYLPARRIARIDPVGALKVE